MREFLEFWPMIVFMFSLFFGGTSIAVGLTLWIIGKLTEQDARRIEVKEAILEEVRTRHHAVMGRIETLISFQNEKIAEIREELNTIDNRVVRIETLLNGRLIAPKP